MQEPEIDRSFVAGLPGRGDATVIASVVGLAHQLGMTAGPCRWTRWTGTSPRSR